jgi:hypothetical protein
MAWSKISREDVSEESDAQFISITPAHFRFNSLFIRQAVLGKQNVNVIRRATNGERLHFVLARNAAEIWP